MGAIGSKFVKATQPVDITENIFTQKIMETEPASSFQEYKNPSGIPEITDNDLKRYTDEYDLLVKQYSGCNLSDEEYKTIKKELDEIENAYKLYLLYDNYKVKNKVINEDLNKKYKNQSKSIKSGYEVVDKINVNIKQLQNSILRKKKTQKILNFILIILAIMIIVIGILIFKKKFANYNFSFLNDVRKKIATATTSTSKNNRNNMRNNSNNLRNNSNNLRNNSNNLRNNSNNLR
tara:strand:- start:4296 stop:5000 length:705 start_codon:yes stop_codon:yes gene_type:complete